MTNQSKTKQTTAAATTSTTCTAISTATATKTTKRKEAGIETFKKVMQIFTHCISIKGVVIGAASFDTHGDGTAGNRLRDYLTGIHGK